MAAWTNDIWISRAKLLYCVTNTIGAAQHVSLQLRRLKESMVGCVGCRCVRDGRARANPVQLLVVPLTLFILSFFLFFLFLVYRLRYCRLMIRLLPLFFHVISFPSTCNLFLVQDDLYYCTCTRTTRFMGFDVSSRAGRIIMIAPRSCAPAPPAVLCSLLRKRHEFFFQSCWREMELDNSATFEKKIKSKKLSERYTQMYYIYAVRLQLSLRVFFSSLPLPLV